MPKICLCVSGVIPNWEKERISKIPCKVCLFVCLCVCVFLRCFFFSLPRVGGCSLAFSVSPLHQVGLRILLGFSQEFLWSYRAVPAGAILETPPPTPDLEPILTSLAPESDPKCHLFRVEISSKSSQSQVRGEGLGGGSGRRGRSGWHGPVAPPEVLEASGFHVRLEVLLLLLGCRLRPD